MEITARKLECINPTEIVTTLITIGVVLIVAGVILNELGS